MLGQFLRLPLEKVSRNAREGTSYFLRLIRSSQLLTSDDYITLLVDYELNKNDIHEMKLNKKEVAIDRREAKISQVES